MWTSTEHILWNLVRFFTLAGWILATSVAGAQDAPPPPPTDPPPLPAADDVPPLPPPPLPPSTLPPAPTVPQGDPSGNASPLPPAPQDPAFPTPDVGSEPPLPNAGTPALPGIDLGNEAMSGSSFPPLAASSQPFPGTSGEPGGDEGLAAALRRAAESRAVEALESRPDSGYASGAGLRAERDELLLKEQMRELAASVSDDDARDEAAAPDRR